MSGVLAETIRIETANRLDAIDLAGRLRGYSLHLIQLSDSRWFVCVRQDRELDVLVREVRDTASRWATERSTHAVMRLGGNTFELEP